MARNPLAPVAIVPDDPNPMLAGVPTQADAMDYNSGAVRDWLARQQAQSAQMGLWNDATGLPTQAGMVNAANQVGQGLLMGSTAPGIRAFHGSPHSFDQFSLDKIGTGEGAQAYGHGLYFAGEEGVAKGYRDALSDQQLYVNNQKVGEVGALGNDPVANAAHVMLLNKGSSQAAKEYVQRAMDRQAAGNYGYSKPLGKDIMKAIDRIGDTANVEARPGGHMYEVNINADPAHFLDWDKPLSEQHPKVQEAMKKVLSPDNYKQFMGGLGQNMTGGEMHDFVGRMNPGATAQSMKEAGIPGIRYLDGGSRGAGEGTSNTVVFDPATIEILRKYGIAGLMAGGTAAASQ